MINKFKLWDVKKKTWSNPAIIKVDKDGEMYYQRDGKHIIFQSTGQLDENGEEIFEPLIKPTLKEVL